MRAIVLSIALMCLSSAAIGQDTPKAVLYDELGRGNCEDFLVRMDALMLEIDRNPASGGVITIAEQDDPLVSVKLESYVIGNIRFRNFDVTRLTVLRTAKADKVAMRFWFVPAGARFREAEIRPWNLSVMLDKPVLFYADKPEFDAVCGAALIDEHFAELLLSSPGYLGNIVLREPTSKRFRQKRSEILKELDCIDESRLRFFHVKSKESVVEYWLVPPKRK